MNRRRPPVRTAVTGLILFVAGLAVGGFGYALIGADRFDIDPEVQNALILSIGAIGASLLAALGVYWAAIHAGAVAANEGEATRRENRRFALIDEKTDVVRRIAVLGNRHAQEVGSQVARRQELAGQPYEVLPRINETTDVEDLVNELYTLGFQATADVANALFGALIELDRFAYVATMESVAEPVVGLSDEEHLSFLAWSAVQKRVKTHMIDVSLTDEGVEHLAVEGTLPTDYLDRQYAQEIAELRPGATLVSAFREARTQSTETTQS